MNISKVFEGWYGQRTTAEIKARARQFGFSSSQVAWFIKVAGFQNLGYGRWMIEPTSVIIKNRKRRKPSEIAAARQAQQAQPKAQVEVRTSAKDLDLRDLLAEVLARGPELLGLLEGVRRLPEYERRLDAVETAIANHGLRPRLLTPASDAKPEVQAPKLQPGPEAKKPAFRAVIVGLLKSQIAEFARRPKIANNVQHGNLLISFIEQGQIKQLRKNPPRADICLCIDKLGHASWHKIQDVYGKENSFFCRGVTNIEEQLFRSMAFKKHA